VLFRLDRATEVTTPGLDALNQLLRNRSSEDRAAVTLEGVGNELAGQLAGRPDIYLTGREALAALGDIADTRRWIAVVGRR
jgi:hypothetical protein